MTRRPANDDADAVDVGGALRMGAERREIRRGEALVRQGEPSDTLYFVLSGRFAVQVEGTDGAIAEIGQGQPVGEIGFFAGLPRTATVAALRDSTVLAITREKFERLADGAPGIRDAVISSLARRLGDRVRAGAQNPATVRTVAVLPSGGSRIPQTFLDALRIAIGAFGRGVFLTEALVASRHRGAALDDPETSVWLNAIEADNDFIFYVADETLTEWTHKCIRHADAVLLVAQAGAPRTLNQTERVAVDFHSTSARRLVILHETRATVVSGTSDWLQERDVFMHHHVALQDTADVERLSRFLAGKALGFVAGGGGALGSAHLGVYKAFREAGADFDMLAGTSVGAAMAAGLAFGVEAERVDTGTHNIFVTSRAFRRLTLPRYGLIDHKGFDRALQSEYGSVGIEDLWKPFFAVSTNLSEHRLRIHRRGPVWKAVRASGSVPGVLPPFFTPEGDMLVDGALMENVPLATMKTLKNGPNVVVALRPPAATRYAVDYEALPGRFELLVKLLNPFSRSLPRVPTVLQVLMRSLLAPGQPDLPLGPSDLLVSPALPEDVRFANWERHHEVFLHAYRGTRDWLTARLAASDPGVLAVVGPKR